ncbi:hypothetical protein DASC09_012490 [Saccharomycopsis crataegensis]|uniref:Uncharacterized protein n=1 Tax=Saccharomycopsis crataegensis TaxID=43959 RepID=A0AAV5QGR9_9ASCO|nr:hypothetical protein DASC09_012490 [Saccharomycopsis crataegensis]
MGKERKAMDLSNLSSNLPPQIPATESQISDLDNKLTQEFKSAANSVAALYRLSSAKNAMLRHKGYLDCLDDLLNMIKLHRATITRRIRARNDQSGRPDFDGEGGNSDGNMSMDNDDDEMEHGMSEFDIESWCLTKKAELMGGENINRGIIFDDDNDDVKEDINGGEADQSAVNDDLAENTGNEPVTDENGVIHYDFNMNMPVNQKFRASMPLLSVDRTRSARGHGYFTKPTRVTNIKKPNNEEEGQFKASQEIYLNHQKSKIDRDGSVINSHKEETDHPEETVAKKMKFSTN